MLSQNLVNKLRNLITKSNVENHQEGCIIVDSKNNIVASGYTYQPDASLGDVFLPNSIHAVTMACEFLTSNAVELEPGLKAYVTYQPCDACLNMLNEHNVLDIEVVNMYKKFDTDKLRYDLVPPSAIKALAEVLSFGAAKYGDNNWRDMPKDQLHRTVGAMMRHFEAYRAGELIDPESGLPHLAHCMTNLAFLIELDDTESN